MKMNIRSRNIPLGLALLSLLATTAAANASPANDAASCRQEIRRVAIWPHGNPKAQQHARFEDREVTVCDGKVVASRKAEPTRQAQSRP